MKAVCSLETSVNLYWTTWLYIQEVGLFTVGTIRISNPKEKKIVYILKCALQIMEHHNKTYMH
jgi:hypothetical protein